MFFQEIFNIFIREEDIGISADIKGVMTYSNEIFIIYFDKFVITYEKDKNFTIIEKAR